MTRAFTFSLSALLAASAAVAQPQVHIETSEAQTHKANAEAIHDVLRYSFVNTETAAPGKVVKGKPFSAEIVNEHIQVLSDGNRIVNKSSSTSYRDGEGRTRRELTLPAIGPFRSEDAPKIVTIHDPVTKTTFTLQENDKTARKMVSSGAGGENVIFSSVRVRKDSKDVAGEGPKIVTMHAGPGAPMLDRVPAPGKPAGNAEQLGKKNIEGVEAVGTRYVQSIPAGEMGNERPIEIVSERWFSEELQEVIMSKTNDPRMGEHSYRLTNIRLGEPAHSLFEVPADYKVVTEDNLGMKLMHDRMLRK